MDCRNVHSFTFQYKELFVICKQKFPFISNERNIRAFCVNVNNCLVNYFR